MIDDTEIVYESSPAILQAPRAAEKVFTSPIEDRYKRKDDHRLQIALSILGIFAGIVLAVIIMAFISLWFNPVCDADKEPLWKTFATTLLPMLVGLLGTVLGFYFAKDA